MFTTPPTDPTALVRAATRTHDQFVQMVGDVVGRKHAMKFAALLFTNVHGVAGLEQSGHLTFEKWRTDGNTLLDLLVDLLPKGA